MLLTLLALAFASEPVALYLNDPVGRDAPKDQCIDGHCQALLRMLRGAERTIDFAIYGVRDQTEIVSALLDAQRRGVRIRGVVDADEHGMNYYKGTAALREAIPTIVTDQAADQRARQAQRSFVQAERCPRPAGFQGPLQCLGYDLGDQCLMAQHASEETIDNAASIMHHKFFVVDNRWVWTGSTNVSDSCSGGYSANLVTVFDAPQIAAWFTDEFEQMYVHGKFHNEKQARGPWRAEFPEAGVSLDAWFSPQDKPITQAVRPLLQGARERIDVAVFFLTHKEITRDLIDAHRRGVKVRVILDATAATNGYTKHELLRTVGIPVKVENWGGKMHMKSAVIDGEHVITGSMNWTSAGEGGNDENTVVLHSRRHAAQYQGYFDQIWASIPDKWLAGRPNPESWDSTASCTDGVDNNFNHLADAADPGCTDRPPPLPPLPPHQIVAKADGEGILLKGVTAKGGELYYVWPKHPAYAQLPAAQATWFCIDADARSAGYKPAPKFWSPEDAPSRIPPRPASTYGTGP